MGAGSLIRITPWKQRGKESLKWGKDTVTQFAILHMTARIIYGPSTGV